MDLKENDFLHKPLPFKCLLKCPCISSKFLLLKNLSTSLKILMNTSYYNTMHSDILSYIIFSLLWIVNQTNVNAPKPIFPLYTVVPASIVQFIHPVLSPVQITV